ncbi:MAG: hypothetical protein KJO36_04255 [Acidimicrobiia bacterium]|nr:hypothetical protein [Acidimicrobiia bacterium]
MSKNVMSHGNETYDNLIASIIDELVAMERNDIRAVHRNQEMDRTVEEDLNDVVLEHEVLRDQHLGELMYDIGVELEARAEMEKKRRELQNRKRR